MPKWFKIILSLFLILSALFTGILFIGYRIVSGSLPKTEGHVLVNKGIHDTISVFRDGYGIAHIIAEDEYDLFFAQGYATAQDRLWQMEVSRRTACGTLAEIFGTGMIRTDIFMRSTGIKNAAENHFNLSSPKTKTILQAYADGVNYYIAEQKKRLPVEFRLVNVQPKRWKPWHSLAVLYNFSWSMNDMFMHDLLSGVLIEHSAFDFLNAPPAHTHQHGNIYTAFLSTADSIMYTALPLYSGCTTAFCLSVQNGIPGNTLTGFNYVSPAVIPAQWYEIHLASKSLNVSGISVPGVPLVLTGQNTDNAWIYVNTAKDDSRILCTDAESLTYTRHEETITSLGDSSVTVYTETCAQGPVFYRHRATGKRLILKSPYLKFADDILCLYTAASSAARSDTQSERRMSGGYKLVLTGPGKTGRFSAVSSGSASVRGNTVYSSSDLIEKHILRIFSSDSSFSMNMAKEILSSDYSPEADSIIRSVIPVLEEYTPAQARTDYSNAVSMLQKWNGSMQASKAEPTIANTFIAMLAKNLLTSYLGTDTYLLYSRFSLVPYEEILYWLNKKPALLHKDIIGRTFCLTLDSLENRYGPDMGKWAWGIDHTVTFSHIMGTNPLLSSALNLGPFPVSGCGASPSMSASFLEYHPRVDIYTSARAIYHISNAGNSISAIATGQSGQPVDEHYRDQAALSIKNLFHPVLLDTAKISKTGWKHLIMKKDPDYE